MEGRPLDERQLIEHAKRGDLDSFEQLVREHQGMAQRVAFLITRDATDAQDATQVAFIKAFKALGRFRAESPFRPWLLRIVSNEAKNQLRSTRRRAGLQARLEAGHPSGDAAPSPEEVALARERRQVLLEALERLRERDRLVISYRYFLNLDEAEMANVMGCARGTVKSRLARALERLRAELDSDGISPLTEGAFIDE